MNAFAGKNIDFIAFLRELCYNFINMGNNDGRAFNGSSSDVISDYEYGGELKYGKKKIYSSVYIE
jgi:uncharacterized membrane protein